MDNHTDITVTVTVNGETVTRRVEARTNLVDFLRYELQLTGSHVGCEHGVCGACTVRMDGRIVRGLLTLAELMEKNPDADRDEIREYISGNFCRCTGYQAIVDAVEIARGDKTDKGAAS